MPLQATSGAASYDGFGGGVPFEPTYIEQVFATHLYTGNGSTQTITNGIDLSTKGGLVWLKDRTSALAHQLFDTARGATKALASNSSGTEDVQSTSLTSFNTTGFSLDSYFRTNGSGDNFVSWTFRKQPKFFDVVTYTGDGNYSTDTPAPYGRAISHALGSTPGFIVIKATSTTSEWYVGARQNDTFWIGSAGAGGSAFALNRTNSGSLNNWATSPMGNATSFFPAQIGAGGSSGTTNDNGVTYVAYLFAHNAGGFGLTGTDNVISCGSIGVSSGGQYFDVNLGYEPQWLLIKGTATSNWEVYDSMRGLTNNDVSTAVSNVLRPNTSGAESNTSSIQITSTGFRYYGNSYNSWGTMIYIAIRRGPMKTPTTGTSVYAPVLQNGGSFVTTNFPVDSTFVKPTAVNVATNVFDRLRSSSVSNYAVLDTATTAAELTGSGAGLGFDNNTGYEDDYFGASNRIYWNFRRAPGFFDVVCYTGNATNGRSITHSLGVVPEILIVKKRSSSAGWPTLITSEMRVMEIDIDSGYKSAASTKFFYGDGSSDIAPTSSVFTVASGGDVNGSGSTYVAYLFASVPGVSKVGSYTGTGALQTIDCGFTGGARFVLIKRTDSTGGWHVYDSARGISSGNDPYLLLDTTAAEVTGTNYVDTTGVGFQVTAAAPAELNANGGSYIFLAIA